MGLNLAFKGLIVRDNVTWIICAPILRTDHFRLLFQKDQRASPRIRLMYKVEMRVFLVKDNCV